MSDQTTNDRPRLFSLATSPAFSSDRTCFVAGEAGLFRSIDGGASWQMCYDPALPESERLTSTVAFSPAFPADRTLFAGVQGGVLCSADGGQTWNGALLASPPPLVTALAVSPQFSQDGTLLAGTLEDGIFRSADRGSHWTACNFGLLDLQILALACSPAFAEDETAFAGAESGLYRSTNGGRSWRDLEIPDALTPVLSVAVSPDYAGDSTLFIGTESCGLWRSRDSGQTWERIGETPVDGSVNSIILAGDMLVLADDRLLISRDGGQTWGEWNAGLAAQGGVTAVSAPFGLSGDPSEAPLLVASVEGQVFWI